MQGSLPDVRQLVTSLQSRSQGMADELATRLQAEAPIGETGDFAASINGIATVTDDGVMLTVVSDDPKAPFIVDPTEGHDIHGNPILAWEGGKYGPGMHFATHVHHPGTVGWGVKVEAMMESLLTDVEDEIEQAIQEAFGQ